MDTGTAPAVLTTDEVATAYLRCHVETVRALINSGQLPAVKVGRHFRIRRQDVEAFLAGDPR
jgi:excisionase family DNA binding protein